MDKRPYHHQILMLVLFYFFPTHLFAITCNNESALSESQKKSKVECEQTTHKEWSCDLNRCLHKQAYENLLEGMIKCDSLSNTDEKSDCFEETAKAVLKADENIDLDKAIIPKGLDIAGDASKYSALALNTIYLGSLAGMRAAGRHCFQMSAKLMTAAAIMGLAGEVAAFGYYKWKSNELKKKYQDEVQGLVGTQSQQDQATEEENNQFDDGGVDDPNAPTEGGAKNAQYNAFEYMEEELKAKAITEAVKAGSYYLSSATFLAATAIAIREQMQVASNGIVCLSKGKIEQRDTNNPQNQKQIAQANAAMKLMATPATRAILAGTTAAIAAALGAKATYVAIKSFQRSKKIKKVKEGFSKIAAGFSECSDRNDISKPVCYCYLDDGTKNFRRLKSETCQKFWTENDSADVEVAAPTDYSESMDMVRGPLVCVNKEKEVDQECECKKTIHKDGKNDCWKADPRTITVGLGSAILGNDMNNMISAFTSGKLSSGSMNTGAIGQFALQGKRNIDQTLASLNVTRKQKGRSPLNFNDFAKSDLIANWVKRNAAISGKFNKGDLLAKVAGGKNGDTPPLLAQAKEIEKNKHAPLATKNKAANYESSTTNKKIENTKDPFDLGGFNNNESKGKITRFANTKDINPKDIQFNSINERPNGPPLWDLLHDRYLKSALPVFFQE